MADGKVHDDDDDHHDDDHDHDDDDHDDDHDDDDHDDGDDDENLGGFPPSGPPNGAKGAITGIQSSF